MSRALTWAFAAVALLLAAPTFAADTVYYYSSDTLHSEVVVTDQNRNVVERTHYAPYGQVLDRDLRDGPGYTGHAEDPETGLVYMQQRYYDPEAGRFLSTDPVQADANGGSFNRYEYASNNPYRYTDPDGRMKNQDQERSPCTGSHIGGGACGSLNLSRIQVGTPSKQQMQLSRQGAQFIARHEGYSNTPYADSAGNPTIGYGHLIKKGEDFSKGITSDQAGALLRQDASVAVDMVNNKIAVAISQTKFDALVDFTYNVGGRNFGKSMLLENINAGKDVTKRNFTDWNHAGGKVVKGLTNRRRDEYNLFVTGDYGGP